MDREEINKLFKEVKQEALRACIPISKNIEENVMINSRPKKRFGCCKKKGAMYQIEISEFMLRGEKDKIKSVLAHEMLHTCPGSFEHGKKWKEYAEIMNKAYGYNIKRVSSFQEMGLEENQNKRNAKYIIKCKKCGKAFARQRKSSIVRNIRQYRCRCGGNLELFVLQDE